MDGPRLRRFAGLALPMITLMFAADTAGTRASASEGTWTRALPFPASGPPIARHGHSMVCDSAGRRVMIFGGAPNALHGSLSDVWSLSLEPDARWIELRPGPGPTGRFAHSAIVDPIRRRMIVYGGNDGEVRGDLWALEFSPVPHWRQLSPSGPPPPVRYGHSAIYDSARDRMVVYGGYNNDSGERSDVWALSLSGEGEWAEITPLEAGPSRCAFHVAVYDPPGDRMILHGGHKHGFIIADLWALSLGDSTRWTPLTPPSPAPLGRMAHSAAYDAASRRMVIYGGANPSIGFPGTFDEIWTLDLAGPIRWNRMTVSGSALSSRHSTSMALDRATGRFVVFGGIQYMIDFGEHAAFTLGTGAAWAAMVPMDSFTPRWGHSVVLDRARQRLVLFGGFGVPADEGVWVFPLGVPDAIWRRVPTQGNPGSRYGHTVALDHRRDRMLSFGGHTATSMRNDLWALSLTTLTWEQLFPGFHEAIDFPSSRLYSQLVYEPARDRLVLWGGQMDRRTPNRVFLLPLEGPLQWGSVETPETPLHRAGHQMVLDAARDRILMFGGEDLDGGFIGPWEESWELALGSTIEWTNIATPSSLAARCFGTMILDSLHRRMIAFGGRKMQAFGAVPFNDLWQLTTGPLPGWSAMLADGPLPTPRSVHAAAWDPDRGSLWICGGLAGPGAPLNDTWQFALFPPPTAAMASVVSSEASPNRVAIHWFGTTSANEPVLVVRAEPPSALSEIGRSRFGPDGHLQYEDTTVRPGRRYRYALRSVDSGAPPFGEVDVEIPAGWGLRIEGFVPNPTPGPGVLRFTTPRRGVVSLDVHDLQGRRIARRVAEADAGPHEWTVPEMTRVPAGLYWIRLEHERDVRWMKVAVAR